MLFRVAIAPNKWGRLARVEIQHVMRALKLVPARFGAEKKCSEMRGLKKGRGRSNNALFLVLNVRQPRGQAGLERGLRQEFVQRNKKVLHDWDEAAKNKRRSVGDGAKPIRDFKVSAAVSEGVLKRVDLIAKRFIRISEAAPLPQRQSIP